MLTPTTYADDLQISPVMVEMDCWESLSGMAELKSLIERRVLLPIDERARATKHGLTPLGAILLFGPPGTGKTALARAIAGRLSWAFLDVDLSLVALDAHRLRELFARLAELDRVVVFFDEFEHLGLRRDGQTTPQHGAGPLTAELLRGLLGLRGRALAVCATNYVRLLDPALLRPGRFDLVLPVGLPDPHDRALVLARLLAQRPCGTLDLDVIVERSAGLTLADLEAVCDRAAQAAFEREVERGRESQIETGDLLMALGNCRPTLSPDEVEAFREDAAHYARV